ncbi:MAG: homoserine O-acetyltransferase [Caulobacteraceae bacterium]
MRPAEPADTAPGAGGGLMTFPDRALPLDCGARIEGLQLAYSCYGSLDAARSNAVLVCHALTLDQYCCGRHPVSGKPGWWSSLIGAGKPLDPARHFIICSNVLGGCMGSTGPSTPGPDGSPPPGLAFPVITIGDMVRAQALLVEALEIERLSCVIGGSMGGMQALQWAADYPARVRSVVCIAAAARHTAQNIALHEVGRQAIMADPGWSGGGYVRQGGRPEKGLAVARMAAHITYLSEAALQRKFGRALQRRDGVSFGFDADFQVESYLRHQGASFIDRFDANAYLYITRAMDYFDLSEGRDGGLTEAFRGARDVRFCIFSFTSDWLYPTAESRAVVRALNAAGARVSFLEVETDKGHDAFLLDEPVLRRALAAFIDAAPAGMES